MFTIRLQSLAVSCSLLQSLSVSCSLLQERVSRNQRTRKDLKKGLACSKLFLQPKRRAKTTALNLCLKDAFSVGGYARGTVRSQAILMASERFTVVLLYSSFTNSATVAHISSLFRRELRSRSIERGFPFLKSLSQTKT